MEEKSKTKIQEKMNDYFDESINSNNYRSEQTKERLNMRKNKIFNLLFSKRKEGIEGFVNGPNEIDINEINCNENIKKDVNNYLKTEYDIKKWFKYIFSSNKNEIYLALFQFYLMRCQISLFVVLIYFGHLRLLLIELYIFRFLFLCLDVCSINS